MLSIRELQKYRTHDTARLEYEEGRSARLALRTPAGGVAPVCALLHAAVLPAAGSPPGARRPRRTPGGQLTGGGARRLVPEGCSGGAVSGEAVSRKGRGGRVAASTVL